MFHIIFFDGIFAVKNAQLVVCLGIISQNEWSLKV